MLKRAIILAVALTTAATTISFAHPHREGGGRQKMRQHGKQQIAQKLQLTEAQQQKLGQMRQQQRAQNKELRERMHQKAAEYQRARDRNDASAEPLRREVLGLRDELELRKMGRRAEFESILSPQQREQMRQMKEEREQRMEKRRENREEKREERRDDR